MSLRSACRVRRVRIVLSFCCVWGFIGAAAAGTLRVPADYPTIQAAIDAAQPGDEVVIADGVYTGAGNKDLDFGDINPFVLYLSSFAAWQTAYPACPAEIGDINGDGTYGQWSFGDIDPFVALLTGQ